MDVKELFNNISKLNNTEVKFVARVRTNRVGKNVSFLNVHDGTSVGDAQVVYKSETDNYEIAKTIRVSSIVEITGMFISTPDKPQPFEISASKILLLDQAVEDYPLQKKEHSLEFLREIAQLRPRTKTFTSIFRIRSSAAFAIHSFFQSNNFVYTNTPILTGNDAEGAGETFNVVVKDDKGNFSNDFFGKQANLTVSGQLNGEAFAQAFKKIYTFGPTFRAENSNTAKHAAEFWMIEPEIAYCDLDGIISVANNMLKYVVSYLLEKNKQDIDFLVENLDPSLLGRLTILKNSDFAKITYSEAIEHLQKAVKEGYEFAESDIKFGMDLGTEHERYICEKIFNKPTFLTNYPKDIKAFYMKQNEDNKTVAAVDMLVPGIGELLGGSQREDNYDKLINRINELDIKSDDLQWYLDLRNYGYYKSAGFGVGFERLVMYLTGASNIRDVIPFPRTPKNILF